MNKTKKYTDTVAFKTFNQVALFYDRIPKLFSKNSFIRNKDLFVKVSISLYNNQFYLEIKYPKNLYYKASIRHFCDLGTNGVIYLKFAPDFPEKLYLDFNTVIPLRKSTIEINTVHFHEMFNSLVKESITYDKQPYKLNSKEGDLSHVSKLKYEDKIDRFSHVNVEYDKDLKVKNNNIKFSYSEHKIKFKNGFNLSDEGNLIISNQNILWNLKLNT